MMFAFALPVLLSAAGLAVDFGTFTMKRSNLQSASDEAAMMGAKQLALASSTDSAISSAVTAYLHNQLTGDDANATSTTTVDRKAASVKVVVNEAWTPFFAHFLNADITPVITAATASLQGEGRLCILTLDASDGSTYSMMQTSHVQAPTCSVLSNSTDPQGMVLQNTSTISAAVICSSGGIKANSLQTSTPPQTDCPPTPDPLASVAAPSIGACTANNLVIANGVVALSPGVYCGGLKINGNATVTFNPGTYIIKNGPFQIAGPASATGTNVAFYLTGAAATLNFTHISTVNLSGEESGPMAGLLFFADRAQPDGTTHLISSINVKSMTGTIYMPSSDLRISSPGSIATTSAYTAIVTKRLRLDLASNLVMNTNYGATAVPVPNGVRTAATVVLTN